VTVRVGALFAGYGGLELALAGALDGDLELVWYCEIEPAACRVMAHRFPGAVNLGDVTAVDWTTVPPVHVVAGGSPCQDLSTAGVRRGMSPGTRSGLWAAMARCVETLRPSLVVWENVIGALSAGAASDLQPCPGCVGDLHGEPAMRALPRVVADLSLVGYDAAWTSLRAADVGAPHGRGRVFLAAAPADTGRSVDHGLFPRRGHPTVQLPARDGTPGTALLPTPVADNSRGLPSPATDYQSLPNAVTRLLPTPTAQDSNRSGSGTGVTLTDAVARHRHPWGRYAGAVDRWSALTPPAPPPTLPSRNGGDRLAPVFVEWMMGLPAGWVTDVEGIRDNAALQVLGNGVVPQQGTAALARLLPLLDAA
jgi:DNA (cytosine-5)-methyltransferase 1